MPFNGSRGRGCERCGSLSHPKTNCPTVWRIYMYNSQEEFDARRARHARHVERSEQRLAERREKRKKSKRGWAVTLVQPSDESGPSDSHSSDEDVPAPPNWDPAVCEQRDSHAPDSLLL